MRVTTALSAERDQLLTAEVPPEGIGMGGVGTVELLFHLLLLVDLEPHRPTVAQHSRGPRCPENKRGPQRAVPPSSRGIVRHKPVKSVFGFVWAEGITAAV